MRQKDQTVGAEVLLSLHPIKENVRLPGFEPGLRAWEAHVITAGPQPRQGLDSRLLLCHFLLTIFKCISFSNLVFLIQVFRARLICCTGRI